MDITRRAIYSFGQLLSPYDAIHDRILTNSNEPTTHQQRFPAHGQPTYRLFNGDHIASDNLLQLIGVESDLALSLLLNINKRHGIAKVLDHPLMIDQHTRIIHFQFILHKQSVKDCTKTQQMGKLLPRTPQDATHAITSITYGIDLLIILHFSSLTESINMKSIDDSLHSICQKLLIENESLDKFSANETRVLQMNPQTFTYSNQLDLQDQKCFVDVLQWIKEKRSNSTIIRPLQYSLQPLKSLPIETPKGSVTFSPLEPNIQTSVENFLLESSKSMKHFTKLFDQYQIESSETNQLWSEIKSKFAKISKQLAELVTASRNKAEKTQDITRLLDSPERTILQNRIDKLKNQLKHVRPDATSRNDEQQHQFVGNHSSKHLSTIDPEMMNQNDARFDASQHQKSTSEIHSDALSLQDHGKQIELVDPVLNYPTKFVKKSSSGVAESSVLIHLEHSDQSLIKQKETREDASVSHPSNLPQLSQLIHSQSSQATSSDKQTSHVSHSNTSRSLSSFATQARADDGIQKIHAAAAVFGAKLKPVEKRPEGFPKSSASTLPQHSEQPSSEESSLPHNDRSNSSHQIHSQSHEINTSSEETPHTPFDHDQIRTTSPPVTFSSSNTQDIRKSTVGSSSSRVHPTTVGHEVDVQSTLVEKYAIVSQERSSTPLLQQSRPSSRKEEQTFQKASLQHHNEKRTAVDHCHSEFPSKITATHIASPRIIIPPINHGQTFPASRDNSSTTSETLTSSIVVDVRRHGIHFQQNKSSWDDTLRITPKSVRRHSTDLDISPSSELCKSNVPYPNSTQAKKPERSQQPPNEKSSTLSSLSPPSPLKLEEPKLVNILLFGQTGVGKSTFINAFANYLQFDTLERAETGKPLVIIPVSFIITSGFYFDERTITFGPQDPSNNENFNDQGHSVTQQCRTYTFDLPETNQRVCIIDTPGFGDTRGIEQDQINIRHINDYITNLPHVDAICCLFKPNESKIDILFRTCFMQLFSVIGENAYDKVMFCFTNSRSTFYAPGNTGPLLKKMLESVKNGQAVKMEKKNTFCFDNEAFRYLVARQNGVVFTDDEQQEYAKSWKRSVQESTRLLTSIHASH